MAFLLDSDIDEICKSLGPQAKEFSGKRILITGARGFLGRYFTDVFMRLNVTRSGRTVRGDRDRQPDHGRSDGRRVAP